jgi:hypothetical protein
VSSATRATLRWTLVAAALASLTLAGCSTTVEGSASPQQAARVAGPVTVADPTAITIPAIGAHSTLEPLGLNPDGTLEVPPVESPLQAGWYAGKDKTQPGDEIQPGEQGTAVAVAHVDGVIDGKRGQPGLFYKLHELKPGDEILIDRADGSKARFLVDRVEKHSKDAFPSRAVYGATSAKQLALVTCTGSFNAAAHSYRDNLVVFSHLDREDYTP